MAYQGPPPGYDDYDDYGGQGGPPPQGYGPPPGQGYGPPPGQGYGPPPGQGYGPPPGGGYYPPYGPPRQQSNLPVAGGILCVIGGLLGLFGASQILFIGAEYSAYFDTGFFMICGAILLIFSIFALLGGAMAIQKKNWALALVGGILGIFCLGPLFLGSLMCLIGMILIAISKDSFN